MEKTKDDWMKNEKEADKRLVPYCFRERESRDGHATSRPTCAP